MQPQSVLPAEYNQLPDKVLTERILRHKERFGADLCILGHHYQSDAMIRLADFVGDSLKLSQQAAAQKGARYIVFCGVHFMAESADVLSEPDQIVCLPNMFAGCAMADMADVTDVAAAIDEVAALTSDRTVPVTYVNSTAPLKALTARSGGACCTSSNAQNVFRWALAARESGGAGGGKIFAIPDQHLGCNTAVALGYSTSDCALYDPRLPNGGLTGEQVRHATFILWKGHCYVHQLFRPEHIQNVRARHEGIRVIVHPECPHEVVKLADAVGSTEQIIRAVNGSPAGAKWAVGTESNLVNRLARSNPERFVRILSDAPSICAMMARIDLPHLLWVLDNLGAGRVVNRVAVKDDIAAEARIALGRMINIQATTDATPNTRR
ncbi:MAG: quinolinate synthase NadA [Phycisphaerae bacterium]|jgi:quinolinate synthase